MGELELLGLTTNQARLLLAMLQLGPATAPDLVEVSGVPRTSIYPVMEELAALGLAHRVSGPGSAVWAAVGRDELLDLLVEAEHERLSEHKAHVERVRQSMAKAFPDEPSASLNHLHVIKGMVQVQRNYARMLAEVERELVMFVRTPHTWSLTRPKPGVMGVISRGVEVRFIHLAEEWEDAASDSMRAVAKTCHAAGASARLAEELPVELVVADRRMALVAMKLEGAPDDQYPLTLWIENPGYAAIHANAFDRRWADSHPLS